MIKKIFATVVLIAAFPFFAAAATYSTPGTYTYTVPSYTSLTIEVWGAGGGGGGAAYGGSNEVGGKGGDSSAGGLVAHGGAGGQTYSVGTGGTATGGATNTTGANGTDSGDDWVGGNGGAGANGGAGGKGVNVHTGFWGSPGTVPGGGGGAQAGGNNGSHDTFDHRGMGGGGGGYSTKTFSSGAFAPGSTITVVVGAGGTKAWNGGQGNGESQLGGNGQVIITSSASAPTAPKITCPSTVVVSAQFPCTFSDSVDSGGEQIHYGIDWNNDGAVEEYTPASGYVASGASSNTTTNWWNTPGTYTFKALAENKPGIKSAWTTSGTITVTAAPDPTVVLQASTPLFTIGDKPATLTWSSTQTTSCAGTNFDAKGATSGSVQVTPVATTTYTITCTTKGTATTTAKVTAPPVTTTVVGAPVAFAFTGADQHFTVPAGVSKLLIKAWGAGGGPDGTGSGGPGGYSSATFDTTGLVAPGQTLSVVVGGGGGGGGNGHAGRSTYGFAGRSGNDGSGGGLSGVFTGGGAVAATDQSRALIIAGGGGGAGGRSGPARNGGPGNGPFAGGMNSMLGLSSNSDGNGGAGGGGYAGGAQQTRTCCTYTGGEGGTGYLAPFAISPILLATPDNTNTAPNNTDADYVSGVGTSYQDGRVVITPITITTTPGGSAPAAAPTGGTPDVLMPSPETSPTYTEATYGGCAGAGYQATVTRVRDANKDFVYSLDVAWRGDYSGWFVEPTATGITSSATLGGTNGRDTVYVRLLVDTASFHRSSAQIIISSCKGSLAMPATPSHYSSGHAFKSIVPFGVDVAGTPAPAPAPTPAPAPAPIPVAPTTISDSKTINYNGNASNCVATFSCLNDTTIVNNCTKATTACRPNELCANGTCVPQCTPVYSCRDAHTVINSCDTSTVTCTDPFVCSRGSCVSPSAASSSETGFGGAPAISGAFGSHSGHLEVRPSLLTRGTKTTVFWNAANVLISSCSVIGSNGDRWLRKPFSGLDGVRTAPIMNATTYTLKCTGTDGNPFTESATVNILPSWQEQ